MPMSSVKVPLATDTDNMDPLVQGVYESIKEGILSNRFRPGYKLTNQEIAESLGVSRTPVRESLERLYQERYVTRIPNRGYFVADIGVDEVRELYETREALELYALDQVFIKGATKAALSELDEINARYRELCLDSLSRERLLVDRQFHLALAQRSGNSYLVGCLSTIFDRLILKRRIEGYHDTRGLVPYEDHVYLIAALREGDAGAAREMLGQHIRGACIRFIDYLVPGR